MRGETERRQREKAGITTGRLGSAMGMHGAGVVCAACWGASTAPGEARLNRHSSCGTGRDSSSVHGQAQGQLL